MSSAIPQEKTAPAISPEKKLEIKNTQKYMLDMLLMLVAPAVMAWYYYGERAVRIIVLSVITAVLCELIGSKIFKAEATISDMSTVITGICVALCVSAAAPWWFPCLISGFAIVVGKLPFGNSRSAMFVPACVGLAFITICDSAVMFAYSVVPHDEIVLGTYGKLGFIEGNSLDSMLLQRNSIGINIVSYIDILVGNVPGAMGTTCGVALLGALIYLIIRRPKTAVIPLCFILTCAVYAFLFPRVMTGRMISVVMELSGGLLFFSALFFMTDESIAPKRLISRVCYGVVGGLIVMLLRSFGKFQDSTVFAVLLVNAISTVFDNKIPYLKSEKKKILEQLAATARSQAEEKGAQIAKTVEENLKIATEKIKDVPVENEDSTEPEAKVEVSNMQDISDIEVTEEKENGGDDNV